MKHNVIPAVAVIACLIASACGDGPTSQPNATSTPLITIDGSSTVFPIVEAMAEEFGKANPDFRTPTVGISGTGGGFQKFCRGEIDVAAASRPISAAERETCQNAGVDYIELPIAYDGIAIVANPANTWTSAITVEELRRLWAPEAQNTIRRWNQVRASWPDREIHLFGAGVDSGTYDYFTEAIVGTARSSRGDFTSSEDDNVLVQGVANDELALGFIPLAYASQNAGRLKIVPLDDGVAGNGDGPVTPSADTVRDGTYQPLSRPLFLYVSTTAADRHDVQQFVDMFFSRTDLVREVGYIELTPQIYELARARFAGRRTGTAFADGQRPGTAIEALYAKE